MSKLLVTALLAVFLPLVGAPMTNARTQSDGYGPIVIYNASEYDVSIWLEGTDYRLRSGDSVRFSVSQEYNRVYYYNNGWVYIAKLVAGQKYKLIEENGAFAFTGGWLY